jgi:hypothetical protein
VRSKTSNLAVELITGTLSFQTSDGSEGASILRVGSANLTQQKQQTRNLFPSTFGFSVKALSLETSPFSSLLGNA